ncbi:MAG: T9SS type A sorting domain-containing protein [Treponema sp.]|nr:T9SS type A sorting domain-containing protein [Treponema sp.]
MSSAILKKLVVAVAVVLTGLAAQAAPIIPYDGVFIPGENGSLSWTVNGADETKSADTIRVRLTADEHRIWFFITYYYEYEYDYEFPCHYFGENDLCRGGEVAEHSDEIVITAIPNAGYKFKEWSDGNTDNPRVASVVIVDWSKYLSVDVTAIFEPQATSITYSDRTIKNAAPRININNRTLTVIPSSHGTAAQVRLIDLRGKTAARFTADRTTNFSLANLPAGRYFAEVREGTKWERISVIVGF